MKKREKVILLGKSGSGKDFLMRRLVDKGLKPGIKWTTRPPRIREIQGVNYNFVSEQIFNQFISNDEFLCHQSFTVTPDNREPETWYYGFTKTDFEQSQVIIMTPEEFKSVPDSQRKDCFVVYLDIPREIRQNRLMNRRDKNDSILRRLDADDEDFKSFKDYDLRITDPEFDADDVYDLME